MNWENRAYRFLMALLLALNALPGRAQSSPSSAQSSETRHSDCRPVVGLNPKRPDYQVDSSQEDWSGLCHRSTEGGDIWDPAKYVGLGPSSWYVSFGGEERGTYEAYRNYNWGSGVQDGNGYYLNRMMGHADFHFGGRIRVFTELQSGLESGRDGGPRPSIDEDKVDASQLFLELSPSTNHDRPPVVLRMGRQELNYGEGTLIATRELNVRRPFDGIKLVLQPQHWRIDAFAVRPVDTRKDAFDDVPDHSQTLWGVWATTTSDSSLVRRLDLYYLGLDRKHAQFEKGTARERRNTLGFNAHEQAGKFSLAQEGDLQLGTFGPGRLVAWKFAQGMFYSLSQARHQPTFGLQGAISSGDKNPNHSDLQTFYPLFPKGLYYGYMVFTTGSLNAIVLHPNFDMQLSKTVSLNIDSFFLWRQRVTDGIYSQSGMFLRSGQPSQSHYIGATQDLSLRWRVDRHTTMQVMAAYYEVGQSLRETQPPGRNVAYLSVTTIYRF